MKFRSLLLLLAFSAAHADNVGPVHARKPLGRFGEGAKPGHGKAEIRGHCEVAAADPNSIATPCSSVILVLTDRDDKSVEISDRTDKTGGFAFAVERGRLYQLKSGSRFYQVSKPTRLLKGGDTPDVKLKSVD